MTRLAIDYVDTHGGRQVVSAVIEHDDGKRYRAGYLPGEQWFCSCPRGRRCSLLAELQALVPRIGSVSKGSGTE
ncbi:hypothetical protein ACIA49_03570 [Kribbella sp. NPDC051587]|uniref:hypothetical protein n=1 Tax=Kribbella sp. NPDC051587 TaxID=3364119 RepID=UPI00379B9879